MKKEIKSEGKAEHEWDEASWGQVRRGQGFLRYQVLFTLLALDVLGLGAGHVDIRVAILQQVVERIQIVRLMGEGRDKEREEGKVKFYFTLSY